MTEIQHLHLKKIQLEFFMDLCPIIKREVKFLQILINFSLWKPESPTTEFWKKKFFYLNFKISKI